MGTGRNGRAAGFTDTRGIVVVSQLRFLREMLGELLNRSANLRVLSTVATFEDALSVVRADAPEIVLIDAAFPAGRRAVEHIREASPRSALIAFGLQEIEVDVISWAEAGMTGYVPNTASIEDLVACIEGACVGEQMCSSRIAGSLLRHLAHGRRLVPAQPANALTLREREVLKLISAGLSNKDIARRLAISLGTTKSHVHNLLGKLNLSRRMDVVRLHDETL